MAARRPAPAAVKTLSPADRAWLEKMLREYRHLLEYLRNH